MAGVLLMERMYCPKCGAYLMTGAGTCVDCHCGWQQEPKMPEPEVVYVEKEVNPLPLMLLLNDPVVDVYLTHEDCTCCDEYEDRVNIWGFKKLISVELDGGVKIKFPIMAEVTPDMKVTSDKGKVYDVKAVIHEARYDALVGQFIDNLSKGEST